MSDPTPAPTGPDTGLPTVTNAATLAQPGRFEDLGARIGAKVGKGTDKAIFKGREITATGLSKTIDMLKRAHARIDPNKPETEIVADETIESVIRADNITTDGEVDTTHAESDIPAPAAPDTGDKAPVLEPSPAETDVPLDTDGSVLPGATTADADASATPEPAVANIISPEDAQEKAPTEDATVEALRTEITDLSQKLTKQGERFDQALSEIREENNTLKQTLKELIDHVDPEGTNPIFKRLLNMLGLGTLGVVAVAAAAGATGASEGLKQATPQH